MQKNSNMNTWFWIGGIILVVFLMVGIVVALDRYNQKPKLTTFTGQNSEAPHFQSDKMSMDLGKIAYAPPTDMEFTFQNTGKSDLEISDVKTSCGCTTAKIEIDGVTSPVFGMHNTTSSWIGKVPAGKVARVLVKYDPASMNTVGEVSRTIQMNTNDPATPLAQFSFKANVVK